MKSGTITRIASVANVKKKQDVINEAIANNRSLHLATLMDPCHLKHAELTELEQQSGGRAVLRGDNVIEDAVGAVFTEQGASASHLTAAKVWDTMSRLPGMSGEANGAVSAHTQVEINVASSLL